MTLNHCGCVVSLEKTSKLEALALFRINLLATRLLSRWCPAYRWRESDAGFYRALREPVALMPREKQKTEILSMRVPMQGTGTEQPVVVRKRLYWPWSEGVALDGLD